MRIPFPWMVLVHGTVDTFDTCLTAGLRSSPLAMRRWKDLTRRSILAAVSLDYKLRKVGLWKRVGLEAPRLAIQTGLSNHTVGLATDTVKHGECKKVDEHVKNLVDNWQRPWPRSLYP